mgnify:CR=1 FL=1
MTLINFDILNERQVSRMIDRVTEKINDLGPYWSMVRDMLRTSIRQQFDSEGGGKWPKLNEEYAAAKMRRFGSKPILQATGEMMRSLTEGGAGEIAREQGDESYLFGSSLRRAAWHQRGAGTLPVRRIIDLNKIDRRQMAKLLQRHLFLNR